MMLELQRTLAQIPSQIERQQPVYLIDAMGKSSLFHLEFIPSAEVSISFVNSKQGLISVVGSRCGAKDQLPTIWKRCQEDRAR